MSVLHIRDKNGNFIPIPAIRGDKGKSAYEQAKEGGYNGTEAEFIALLNNLPQIMLNVTALDENEDINESHLINFSNPHSVTAAQTGAIPEAYHASSDLNTELQSGGNKMTICNYHSETLNTPYKEGLTVFAHGMVITNANSNQYGTQMCMPSGEDAVYVRRLNRQGISKWVRMADMSQINSLTEKDNQLNSEIQSLLSRMLIAESGQLNVAQGSYKGTNTYGVSKPNTLTFDFVPLFVIVARRGVTNINSGGTFIWIYPNTTLNFINNGSTYWCHPTLTDKTLSWYNTESAVYQLNSSSYDYDYIAWGRKE